MAAKRTSWFDDLVMAASRRGNDIVGGLADLADRYGVTPANAAAWVAQNIERRSPEDVARIRRNLAALPNNRAIVEAGVRSNENRFRAAGGRGSRAADDVQMPVRLAAAGNNVRAIPGAIARSTPRAAQAVSNYVAQTTPMQAARDTGALVMSGLDALRRDPYGSVFEGALYANPLTATVASGGDYAAMREASASLDPYVAEDREAAEARDMVDALSVLPLAVPLTLRKVKRRKRGGRARG